MSKAGGIRAGSAFVELYTNDNQLVRGLKKAGARVEGFAKGLSNVGVGTATVGGAVAGVGATITAPFVAASKTFAQVGDAVQKLGIRTDASTGFLSELGFAAEQSGTDLKTVGDAIFRMNRRVANATSETGPAVRALEELGMSAKALNGLTTEQRFLTIADALSKMSNQTRAAQLGFEIFGDNFKQIQPLLAEGADGINKLRKEAAELGVTLSDADAEGAAALADSFNRISTVGRAAFMKLGAAVAPVLTDVANQITEIGTRVVSWVDNNRPIVRQFAAVGVAVTAIGGAVAGLGGSMIGLGSAMVAVKTVGAIVLPLLTVGFAVAAAKVGLVVAAIGAVYAGFGYVLHRAGLLMPAFDYMKESFARVYGTFKETFGGIVTALGSGQFKAAAGIAWSGVKVVTLQATQQVLKGIEGLWDNAGNITHRFIMSMGTMIVKAFKALPSLAWAALKGGKSLAGVFAKTMEGVFSKKIDFASTLDPAIQKAEAELKGRIATIEHYKKKLDEKNAAKSETSAATIGVESPIVATPPGFPGVSVPVVPSLPQLPQGRGQSVARVPRMRFQPQQPAGPPLDDQYQEFRQIPTPQQIVQQTTPRPQSARQIGQDDSGELLTVNREQLAALRRIIALGGLN